MTAQECLFCASSEAGNGELFATGRTEIRPSRHDPAATVQRYELECWRCGYRWWFAGHWAADKYQAALTAHPELASLAPAPTPQPDVIPQRSIPGTRVLQSSSGLTSTGQLARDWKQKQAGDDEDVA